MKIAVAGTGYVGLSNSILLSQHNKVVAVDYTQSEEDKLTSLRTKRNNECFNIINRGLFWYEKLSEKQKEELKTWYLNWLDVTVTKVIPQKPNWLN